jgi:hypothetical protein
MPAVPSASYHVPFASPALQPCNHRSRRCLPVPACLSPPSGDNAVDKWWAKSQGACIHGACRWMPVKQAAPDGLNRRLARSLFSPYIALHRASRSLTL